MDVPLPLSVYYLFYLSIYFDKIEWNTSFAIRNILISIVLEEMFLFQEAILSPSISRDFY